MKARELAEKLAQDIERVCQTLFPEGKRIGSEWTMGSLSGNAGSSLKIHLSGAKAGVWADFATGESGDIIDLWRKSKGISFSETLSQIRAFLGIRPPEFSHAPRKEYAVPKESGSAILPGSPVWTWLEGRGIRPETFRKFRLEQKNGAVVFPYYRGEQVVHQKFRSISEKKFWASGGTEPAIFGWQAFPDDSRSVVICEGEMDCLALSQYGYAALSVPFGAGTGGKLDWIDTEYERLEPFDEIFLCMDNDAPGQDSLPEMVRRLGRDRCRIVSLPAKDANDCLMKGIASLDPYFQNAAYCDPEGLCHASEYLSGAIDILHGTSDHNRGIPLPWCDKMVFRPAELTIWNGINGHGKSSLLNHLTLEWLLKGEAILYCSHEMNPERVMAQMIRQACGDRVYSSDRIERMGGSLFSRLYLYTGKKDRMGAMRYAVQRYGTRHIVIDNLTRLTRMDDYSGQQALVQEISDLKDELKIHIHLVTHARKGESETSRPDKFDVRGAGPITDIADNVITIHRNKEKTLYLAMSDWDLRSKKTSREQVAEWPDAKIYVQKQRIDGWEGAVELWYDPSSCQFGSKPEFFPVKYDEEEEPEIWNFQY